MTEINGAVKTFQARNDLKILVAVMSVMLVFVMAARTPLETDFWWHIRAGEVTWQSHAPLLTDQFTFTRMGQPWINHSWLAEVVYYLVYRAGGLFAVGLLVALLAAGSMLLVYLQMEGPDLLKAAFVILGSTVAAGLWSPRPQLFTIVLFAGIYLILNQFKYQSKDRLWILPILFVVWSNFHAGFSLGFLLLGAFIAGEVFNFVLNKSQYDLLPRHGLRKLLFWTTISALVVMINPNGVNTWLIQFRTVGVDALRQNIDEWASPDFHQLALQPFLWLLFAALAAIGMAGRKVDGVDLIGLIGFGYLAFLAKRNFAPFAIFATPVLARYAWAAIQRWKDERNPAPGKAAWLQRLNQRFGEKSLPKSMRKAINLTMIAILAFIGIGKLVYTTSPIFVEKALSVDYPIGAVRFLQGNQLSGRIFNAYGWGGYLEWNLRDSTFYIDGRTDLFGNEITGEWIKLVQAQEGWQDTLRQWGVQYALLEPYYPLVSELKTSGVPILYEDSVCVLFDLSN